MDLSRSTIYYESQKEDGEVEQALLEKAEKHPREGFWKAYHRLRNEGRSWNHKRVHRVYVNMGLPLRRKAKKRLPARVKTPLETPTELCHTWSLDFMQDRLINGRKVRCLCVLDDANREMLHIESDFSLPSSKVIWVMNHLIGRYGKPQRLRTDNGPEFIAHALDIWSQMHGIEHIFIQPGKPTQNGFVERFNGSLRRGVLDAIAFRSIQEMRTETAAWMHDYNHFRPHESLGNKPPVQYAKEVLGKTRNEHLSTRYESPPDPLVLTTTINY
jgi:putative transposase